MTGLYACFAELLLFFYQLVLYQAIRLFDVIESQMEVEIVSDAALKLRYCKLTVTRTYVYCSILLLLQQLEDILLSSSQQSLN